MADLTSVPVLSSADVARLLPYVDLVAALDDGHRAAPSETRRLTYGPDGTDQALLLLPAWSRDEMLGVKVVTVFPDNPGLGLPSVQAVYLLFDGANGSPVAIVDGTELTYRKTAASSALASRYLSRVDSHTLLMVGAGALAPHLVAAHRAVRPSIERVLVWNRTRSKAEALAAELGGTVVDDLSTAVAEADIVSTATMAADPLVEGAWLRRGTHLDCVGAFRPDTREIDDECVRRSSVYIDSPAALDEAGDLVIPMASGVIDAAHVIGDLTDLCTGRVPGRGDPDAITLFESLGGGHLDLMTARALHTRFVAEGART